VRAVDAAEAAAAEDGAGLLAGWREEWLSRGTHPCAKQMQSNPIDRSICGCFTARIAWQGSRFVTCSTAACSHNNNNK